MFTRKDFEFQAELLGSHVIPMCISYHWEDGRGIGYWDVGINVVMFHRLGHAIITRFRENPLFDLDKFNNRIWEHFLAWLPKRLEYLTHDRPGMTLAESFANARDWTFGASVPSH